LKIREIKTKLVYKIMKLKEMMKRLIKKKERFKRARNLQNVYQKILAAEIHLILKLNKIHCLILLPNKCRVIMN